MPWADTVFQDLDNWVDCIWQDWDDCEWDKFSIVYQDAKTRTMRQLPPEGVSNFRRPYLEGNPSYVEDNLKYPDVAVENARINVKDEVRPHMTMKQPYRYQQFQKMKYWDEPVNDKLVETPGDIMAEEVPKEYEWQWVRYFDNKRWTPSIGEWFDNRWLEDPGVEGAEVISSTADGYISKGGSSFSGWDFVHDAQIGSGLNRTVENYSFAFSVRYFDCTGGHCYQIRRCFFYFDLSPYSGTVSSCSLVLRGDTNEDASVSVQQGTQASSLSTSDYGSFAGDEFGHTSWDGAGDNTITFNSDGLSYIQSIVNGSGAVLLCCREYDHDYLDAAPSEDERFASGCYFADSATEAYRPQLIVGGVTSGGGLDISVVPSSWWKDLRPKKFRMKFDNATADVSLQDKSGTEIYANATYASGTEVDLAFAGADIDRLVVSGSGDVADIELFHQVEKGLYLDSNQKSPRKEAVEKPQRFPDPNPIRPSERIARRTNLRPIR